MNRDESDSDNEIGECPMNEKDQNLNALMDLDLLKLVVRIGEVSKITGIPTRKIRYLGRKRGHSI